MSKPPMAPTGAGPTGPGGLPAPDTAAALQRLRIWTKLKKGDLHAVTKENVQELFNVLDQEERGEVALEDLQVLRSVPDVTLTQADIEDLMKDCDKDGSGRVSPDEFYKALTQGEVAFSLLMDSLNKKSREVNTAECDRESLIDYLHEEYDTSSALWSMPQTMLLFLIFFLMVTLHLDVTTAYNMQSGLLNEIEGEGAPYLHDHPDAIVHDVPTLWQWMQTSMASAAFKNDLNVWPYPGRIGSFNQMVGGIVLSKYEASPTPCQAGDEFRAIYDTQTNGMCHHINPSEEPETEYLLYHEKVEDLIEHMVRLQNENWIDQNTTMLDMGILFYNGHLKAFTAHHLEFHFVDSGYVKILFSQETFLAEPYHDPLMIIPDLIFCFIIFRMFYSELKELVPACLNGLDGFMDYLEFWNVVDWVSIIFGIVVMVFWGMTCQAVNTGLPETIGKLPTRELDNQIRINNNTFLSYNDTEAVSPHSFIHDALDEVHLQMDKCASLHELVRQLVFFYMFVLMMKFFKAFRANPRLNIVIKTIEVATVDLAHFAIVFLVIFCVFSSAGYIMFGNKIFVFSDQRRSMIECWVILMGDFDLDEMHLVNQHIADIWFTTFTILVLNILLNMLLAIIMDTYTEVKAAKANPITIWAQIREAIQTVKETRGHLDMWMLICEFEDDDYPAHPGKQVTSRSLRRAFEQQKMTKHNADYLIRKTALYLKDKEGDCDLGVADAVRIIGLVKTQVLKIAEVTETMLDYMREDRRRPQQARYDAIMSGNDPEQLKEGLAKGGGMQPGMNGMQPGVQMGMPPGAQMGMQPNMQMGMQNGMGAPNGFMNGADYGAGTKTTLALTNTSNFALTNGSNNFGAQLPGMPGQTGAPGTLALQDQQGALARTGSFGNNSAAAAQASQSFAELKALLGSLHGEQQRTADVLEAQLREQRQLAEQRDEWMQQRLNVIDRKIEKVERANDRVFNAVQAMDAETMQLSLDKLHEMISTLGPNGSYNEMPIVVPVDEWRGEQGYGEDRRPSHGASKEGTKKMEVTLDSLCEQVANLAAHQEEASEMRKLLWKMDLRIRQMQSHVMNPPVVEVVAPPKEPPLRQSLLVKKTPASTAAGSKEPPSSAGQGAAGAANPSRPPSSVAGGPAPGSRLPSVPGGSRPPTPGDPPRPSDSPNWSVPGQPGAT
mmetsp:Transcript_94736/g.203489  ORF Transcript_94736/g.203489 Transcript_94736/m.203489 type:complete len:1171 (-) Transcript_94736:72-3584(-)